MKILARIKGYSFTAAHYLFAAVVLLRLIALARLSSSAFLLPSRGDMHFYNDWARRILQGEFTDHFAFYGLPLYAYLLAFLYKVFGYGPFIPALLQALLDGGTAVLIYRLTLRVWPEQPAAFPARSTITIWPFIARRQREITAVFAGLGWGFFVPAQAYSVILMPTTWLVFVFWFVVWRIVRREDSPRRGESLWLGLLIGFTAMGVATILFLIPLVLAALFLRAGKIDNRKWTIAAGTALLLAGIALGTSPCWIHNYFVARDPVVLSAHSGINFWIGNNPAANGYPRFPPGLRAGQAAMLEDSITAAESAAGHSLKRAEVSAYWSAKANDYVTHHLLEWLRLLGRKFQNFWSAFQYDDLSIITILREHGIILPGIYFGLVAALALPGMVLAWRIAPRSRWILFAILLHLSALLPVFVTERYRLAVVPGLFVFAAMGLSILWSACAAGARQTILTYAAVVTLSTLFVSWPQKNPSLWALDAYNSGWQALESNNLPLAEKKLSLARAYVPENAETNFAFANLRLAQGNREAATSFYREVLRIDRDHKGALNNLGVIALEAHDIAGAKFYFEQALARDPRNAKTHFLLARTSLAAGDLARAESEIARALEIAPAQSEFRALQKELAQRKPAPQ